MKKKRTVCRALYVHPAVLKAYQLGITLEEFRPKNHRRIKRTENEYEVEERASIRLFWADV